MRYFTMNIKPDRERWTAFVTEDATERRETKTLPNVLGFYHYPVTLSKQTAFNRLKQRLVKSHEKEIVRLQRSLKALQKLTLK